jgi:hypothetical protein
MFINLKTGHAFALVGQDREAHFRPFGKPDAKPQSVPSHEFFRDHREATREEIEEATAAEPKTDAAKDAAASAKAAEKSATAADRSATAAANHEDKAKAHATAAAESAKAAKVPPAKAS